MARFLIAGASGYLGARLTKDLRDMGHEVWALGRRPVQETGEWQYLEMDLSREEELERLKGFLEEKEIEAVVHLISMDHRQTESLSHDVFAANLLSLQLGRQQHLRQTTYALV